MRTGVIDDPRETFSYRQRVANGILEKEGTAQRVGLVRVSGGLNSRVQFYVRGNLKEARCS